MKFHYKYKIPPSNQGFTLIELSIVLVIIGLIIGGILVGRDLISAAEIRGTISQMDKYKAAYQTFRLKYNCIPGDCINASQFGFKGWYDNLAYTNGDGDGLIYTYNDGTTNDATNYGATPKLAESWSALGHLFGAGLIATYYRNSMATTTSNVPIKGGFIFFTSLRPSSTPAGYLLPDRPGNYLYLSVYPENIQHFSRASPVLTPAQAFVIDSKLDDGLPMSGNVRASQVSYDCPEISSSWRQGPCFNIPATKTNVVIYGGNAVASATVDDTVTPATYRVNITPISGFQRFYLTSIHVPVD